MLYTLYIYIYIIFPGSIYIHISNIPGYIPCQIESGFRKYVETIKLCRLSYTVCLFRVLGCLLVFTVYFALRVASCRKCQITSRINIKPQISSRTNIKSQKTSRTKWKMTGNLKNVPNNLTYGKFGYIYQEIPFSSRLAFFSCPVREFSSPCINWHSQVIPIRISLLQASWVSWHS